MCRSHGFRFGSSVFQSGGTDCVGLGLCPARGEAPSPTLTPLAALFFPFLALCPRPAFLHALSRTSERQRIRRNILGDATCGRDIGAASNLYRRDQGRVAADEHTIFDHGLVLAHTIVIAGDGARAYIDAFTDFRVAQIAEMVRLRTLAQ